MFNIGSDYYGTRKESMNWIETNPFAIETRKDLREQILHQISVVRYSFTFAQSIVEIYNSIQALHDMLVSLLNAKYFATSNDDLEDFVELKRVYTNPALKVIYELEKENKDFIERVKKNPQLLLSKENQFKMLDYLHKKFMKLIEIAIRRNIVVIRSKYSEVV